MFYNLVKDEAQFKKSMFKEFSNPVDNNLKNNKGKFTKSYPLKHHFEHIF